MFNVKFRYLNLINMMILLMVTGCAGKAQCLKVAVGQFETESLAAIQAIDDMHKKELATETFSSVEKTYLFVENVLKSSRSADQNRIEHWLNPYKPGVTEKTQAEWIAFIDELKNQYVKFASIYNDIERASFTGRELVPKGIQYIENLIAQIAYFAKSVDEHPPKLLNRRGALIAELEKLRMKIEEKIAKADRNKIKSINKLSGIERSKAIANLSPRLHAVRKKWLTSLADANERQAIAQWQERWLALVAEEDELKRKTVEQCIKAVTIGLEIRKKMKEYNQISLEDISEALNRVLVLAGTVTGENYSRLQAQADKVFKDIKNDPVWQNATDLALREVNKAIKAREKAAQPESDASTGQ